MKFAWTASIENIFHFLSLSENKKGSSPQIFSNTRKGRLKKNKTNKQSQNSLSKDWTSVCPVFITFFNLSALFGPHIALPSSSSVDLKLHPATDTIMVVSGLNFHRCKDFERLAHHLCLSALYIHISHSYRSAVKYWIIIPFSVQTYVTHDTFCFLGIQSLS